MNAKETAIAQIERAIRAIHRALQILDSRYDEQRFSIKKKMLKVMNGLNERLVAAKIFRRHLTATIVKVGAPTADSYKALDQTLAKLQAIKADADGVRKILQITAAVGTAVMSTRDEVSSRTI